MRPDAPSRLDLYLVRARLGHSADCRPCIIVEPSLEIGVAVVLVSSSELYKPEEDFAIEATRAEFKATGLKRTSYAVGRAFVAVPLSALGKRLGRLEGKLASEFEIWYTRHKA